MGCSKHAPHGDWPVKGGNSSLSHCLSAPSLFQTRSPLHSKPLSVLRTHAEEGLQTQSEAVQSRSSHLSPCSLPTCWSERKQGVQATHGRLRRFTARAPLSLEGPGRPQGASRGAPLPRPKGSL